MTAVVADTSPLNYLVIAELRSHDDPLPVRQWAAALPAWVEVRAVAKEFLADPRWQPLHAGEQEALALAVFLKADLVLMDERTGVAVARESGFRVTGTLGILDEAARQELLDFATVMEKLKATTFRYPRSLVADLLAESRERRRE